MINNKMYFNNEILKNESREQKCQFEKCIYYNNHSSVSMFIAAVSVLLLLMLFSSYIKAKLLYERAKRSDKCIFSVCSYFPGPGI